MAKKAFRPQDLRALLSFVLVAVILGGGALFYFGLNIVQTYAVDVNHRLLDAEASDKQVQQLQNLKNQLTQSQQLVTKADQLFSTPETYQAQILTDVQSYASQVGLSIASTNFINPENGGSYGIVVRFTKPISYSKLIQFLKLTETNLPKLQVASIDLKHVNGGGADTVEAGDITLNVLVR